MVWSRGGLSFNWIAVDVLCVARMEVGTSVGWLEYLGERRR